MRPQSSILAGSQVDNLLGWINRLLSDTTLLPLSLGRTSAPARGSRGARDLLVVRVDQTFGQVLLS